MNAIQFQKVSSQLCNIIATQTVLVVQLRQGICCNFQPKSTLKFEVKDAATPRGHVVVARLISLLMEKITRDINEDTTLLLSIIVVSLLESMTIPIISSIRLQYDTTLLLSIIVLSLESMTISKVSYSLRKEISF